MTKPDSRRTFLKTSLAASTSLLLAKLDVLAEDSKPEFIPDKNFDLKILATNWGFDGSMDSFCDKVKKEGYDGIEVWWPGSIGKQNELFTALTKYSLDVGFLCGGNQSNAKEHLESFSGALNATAFNKNQKPLYINCHSGRDYFSFEENKRFIDLTTSVAKQSGLLICHETHRSRMLYSAPVAKEFILKNPELRLTADLSHWCTVSESFLADQADTVNLALSRTDHIHARIGHAEGPQVNDPRAPEWEHAVKAHFAWWDKVVEMKRKDGKGITFLTEFGPVDYMPAMPYTRQPLADQWAINVHMLKLLRNRYSS
ncbi:sugar phosphate isomerase/epimerase family protein [Daejeonella sp.]|uniref:sugar phosphate isomerase/epimerase family protein n=1 Tax=Daejeonella sp. TaxID=2805397 RepID=UPI00398372E8